MRKINIIIFALLFQIAAKAQVHYAAVIYGNNGVIASDTIYKKDLLEAKGLNCLVFFDKYPKKIDVLRFEMMTLSKNDSSSFKNDINGILTVEMQEKIKNLPPNSEVYFQGIVGIDKKTNIDVVMPLLKFIVM